MSSLPIHQMASRHSGLTPAIADSNAEAAAVCLDRHHEPPQDMELDRDGAASIVAVDWIAPNARVKQAWANEIDATEAGACACALALPRGALWLWLFGLRGWLPLRTFGDAAGF